MIPERYLTNLSVAYEALISNQLRSLLTALGIIFGVAAVIAMLAVGNGTKKEILDQIALLGVNNIVVSSKYDNDEDEIEGDTDREAVKKYSPGLTLQDAESIIELIPTVERISPEVVVPTRLVKSGRSTKGSLVGIEPYYFDIGNFELDRGRMFNTAQLKGGEQVCIIGNAVRTRFFAQEDPIGKFIKCGPLWFKVIGVLKEKRLTDDVIEKHDLRDFNFEVYTPIRTVLIRYKNRQKINKQSFSQGNNNGGDENGESKEQKARNYHQLDKLTIKVAKTERLVETSRLVEKMLLRRHFDVPDFQVKVPEQALKAEQKNKTVFTVVLACIACLSLLIGGIGIMNIMLASVLERIKEIGLRQSLGARKNDIVMQFLIESMLISLSGGIIGVILGVTGAFIITSAADIPTAISGWSILLSFSVSILVGLVFGIMPAKRASEQNPINSLRYE